MKTVLMATVLAFGAQAALPEGVSSAVVGGKADDPFFAKVKTGIDDATLVVAADGGTVNYLMLQNYDNISGDAVNLVRTAISQGASVIAVPNWVHDAEDEAITVAMDAGNPVTLYNSAGADKATRWAQSTTSATKNIRQVWRQGLISAAMASKT